VNVALLVKLIVGVWIFFGDTVYSCLKFENRWSWNTY